MLVLESRRLRTFVSLYSSFMLTDGSVPDQSEVEEPRTVAF